MPFLGATIPLSHQQLDGDATKFVRAVLEEADGTPIAGSPFAMVNLGLGKYSNDSVAMPAVDYLECRYESFNDALFTIEDPDHLFGTDVFELTVPDSVILEKLNEILAKLEGIALPGAAINVAIVQNTVREVIQDLKQTKALIEGDDVLGIVKAQDQATKVVVDDGGITAKVD